MYPFTQFAPTVSPCKTRVQHQNQDIDVGRGHRTYSGVTVLHAVICVCVCVYVHVCVYAALCHFITSVDHHNQNTELLYQHKLPLYYLFIATTSLLHI